MTSVLILGALALCPSASSQSALPNEPVARVPEAEDTVVRTPIAFEGFVLESDGTPAVGAVVVSSAGGRAVTDASGRFRFEADVPLGAEVQVTAVGASGTSRVACASVAPLASSGPVNVGSVILVGVGACAPSWVPTFTGGPGIGPSYDNGDTVYALAEFDDGSGPALFGAGDFARAGGVEANKIAKWDGSAWAPLDGELAGDELPIVRALAVYDDGSGPALYVGGRFTTAGGVVVNDIARWDGTSWSALGRGVRGGGLMGSDVFALTVYDDGSGPALYAGGEFTSAGEVSAWRVARWDGAEWTALGTGISGAPGSGPYVDALTVYDDGSGPALVVGGKFSTAGGVSASDVARWDGSSWTALGSGLSGVVVALATYDDGNGPALVAGGSFAGGSPPIQRWNGVTWTPVGSGWIAGNFVYALTVFDDGGGPALYSGGSFTSAGGVPANNLAKWDGSSWQALSSGADGFVQAFAVHDDGRGTALFAGGRFVVAGGLDAHRVARWDGASWSILERGSDWIDGIVRALLAHDDGGGPALFAGGEIAGADGSATNNVAKWDGASWSALDSGTNGPVLTLASYDDGGGAALYAGGDFTSAGGVAATCVAKWDGSDWSALGSGISGAKVNASVVHDDGGGPALFVGGEFFGAGGAPASFVARWDGTGWAPLGAGTNGMVNALAVYDDGSGAALIAAGQFTTAGGIAAKHVAKWNGSTWAALGAGVNQSVSALIVHDDGSGPMLYAAWMMISGSGTVSRWNGSTWSTFANFDAPVSCFALHDDGSGPALYAGGFFTAVGSLAVNRVAKWDGASWSGLAGGKDDRVSALSSFADPAWPALYAGGYFTLDDPSLAKWSCLDLAPTLACPPSVHKGEQIGSAPGEIVTFTVTATDDHDPSPVVVCTPPSGSFFPQGTTQVTCTATDSLGHQSTCQFPVVVALKAKKTSGF